MTGSGSILRLPLNGSCLASGNELQREGSEVYKPSFALEKLPLEISKDHSDKSNHKDDLLEGGEPELHQEEEVKVPECSDDGSREGQEDDEPAKNMDEDKMITSMIKDRHRAHTLDTNEDSDDDKIVVQGRHRRQASKSALL